MEFRETLLAAQKNQQHKSSQSTYYKAGFDPPKKEREAKPKDRLSANIQKFLAKKEEEERQKQKDAKRKRDELFAMRDSKALKKIQKTLKVIKSANKSVLADAIDTEHTAVTLAGPDQPDQDDYGYESQEAAALYQKMMEKYSKLPEEPKFPSSNHSSARDIHGTRERVRNALLHEDEPIPHKRRRKTEQDREPSPPPKIEVDKRRDIKSEKPKFKKPMPPIMDFNSLLKLAEQKKDVPIEVAAPKKVVNELEAERPMTKKQKREYEEEMERRMRRQQAVQQSSAARDCKGNKHEKPSLSEDTKKDIIPRIPKLNGISKNTNVNILDKRKPMVDKNRNVQKSDGNRVIKDTGEKNRPEKEQRSKTEKNQERDLKKDRNVKDLKQKTDFRPAEKTKPAFPSKINDVNRERMISISKNDKNRPESIKSIDIKSQNTYRIHKNNVDRKLPVKNGKPEYRPSIQSKQLPKPVSSNSISLCAKQKNLFGEDRDSPKAYSMKQKIVGKSAPPKATNGDRKNAINGKTEISKSATAKPKTVYTFDFDKHISSLNKNVGQKVPEKLKRHPGDAKKIKPDDIRRKQMQRRRLDSDEYDSEMDDFIDDGEEEMDYSKHIKEIFGYDKSRYQDDADDPTMESSFSRQMHEEYVSKKIGIMEDLEDMRMEAMEKKMKSKKRRRIDD